MSSPLITLDVAAADSRLIYLYVYRVDRLQFQMNGTFVDTPSSDTLQLKVKSGMGPKSADLTGRTIPYILDPSGLPDNVSFGAETTYNFSAVVSDKCQEDLWIDRRKTGDWLSFELVNPTDQDASVSIMCEVS